MIKQIILQEVLDEILSVDENIRFVGIYHNGVILTKKKRGIEIYLDSKETEKSIHDAIYRWKKREEFSKKIDSPVYSITKYGKVHRITISIPEGLILVSCEPNIDPISLIDKISSVRDWYIF